ncbi:hypothetical protein Ciccas_011906 [Cichlidogyrus casuarinus]|uniref:Uncharacterized protein n=1 Tax=Cichlidogyrus casuarinus TaxID=1844966 RepID=A0ABD2PUU1_9PLAT
MDQEESSESPQKEPASQEESIERPKKDQVSQEESRERTKKEQVSQEQVAKLRSFFEENLHLTRPESRARSPSLSRLQSVSRLKPKFETGSIDNLPLPAETEMPRVVSITGDCTQICKAPSKREEKALPISPRYMSLVSKPASPIIALGLPRSPRVPRSNSSFFDDQCYPYVMGMRAFRVEADEKDLMDVPDGFYVRTGQVYERVDEPRFANKRMFSHWISTIFTPEPRDAEQPLTELTNIWNMRPPYTPYVQRYCTCHPKQSYEDLSPRYSRLHHSTYDVSSPKRRQFSPESSGSRHSPAPYRCELTK